MESLVSSPEFIVFALMTTGTLVGLGARMYRDQKRVHRRLEGDPKDGTNPGFFEETEQNFDHIEERLDQHNERFDQVDEKLEEIVQHIVEDEEQDVEFGSGRWTTSNGNGERETSRSNDDD